MTPEVKLEVELLDTQRQPIEGKHVSFAAIDGYCTTYKDVNGVYSIDKRTDYIYEAGRLVRSLTFDTTGEGISFADAREKISGELIFDEDGKVINERFYHA